MSETTNYMPPDDGLNDSGGSGNARVIQGTLLRFANEGQWKNSNGEAISPQLELCVHSVARVVQKWIDDTPLHDLTRHLHPSEAIPDLDAMNDKCPKSEWGVDFNNKPKGPWQFQHIIYLFNLDTYAKYSWPFNTVGGNIAREELVDATKMKRLIANSPNVYPVIVLGSAHMNTAYGGRLRASLIIKRWISFGAQGALPGAPAPAALPPAEKPAEKKQKPNNDDLNDEINF